MDSVHFSSQRTKWETPQDFFDKLHAEFCFTLDVCATMENAKCFEYFTPEQDGLKQSWEDNICYMNPPYGREISKWVEKAATEVAKNNNTIVVALLPSRTDTKYFHRYIYKKHEVRFLKGRLKFSGHINSAPFPSMVVVFKKPQGL